MHPDPPFFGSPSLTSALTFLLAPSCPTNAPASLYILMERFLERARRLVGKLFHCLSGRRSCYAGVQGRTKNKTFSLNILMLDNLDQVASSSVLLKIWPAIVYNMKNFFCKKDLQKALQETVAATIE